MTKVIAVDFDGTIAEHKYPSIGNPVPGAFKWMKEWQAAGAKLILWTMRDKEELNEAVDFCKNNGVEFFGINNNPEQKSWTESPKVYSHIYVDDAAFGCPLRDSFGVNRKMVDWDIVGPEILKVINENKKQN